MGSLNAPPKLPADPRPARAAGIRPSILPSWPPASKRLPLDWSSRWVATAKTTLPTLIFAVMPRQAGAPGPAMLIGGLVNPAADFLSMAAWAWAVGAASTVLLTIFLISTRSNSETMGGLR